MNCDNYRRWLSPYLDKQLSAEQRSQLDAHLRTCAPCRGELASLRKMLQTLHAMDRPASPELIPGIHEALQQSWWRTLAKQFMAPWPASLPVHGVALAATAVLVVVTVGLPRVLERGGLRERKMQLASGPRPAESGWSDSVGRANAIDRRIGAKQRADLDGVAEETLASEKFKLASKNMPVDFKDAVKHGTMTEAGKAGGHVRLGVHGDVAGVSGEDASYEEAQFKTLASVSQVRVEAESATEKLDGGRSRSLVRGYTFGGSSAREADKRERAQLAQVGTYDAAAASGQLTYARAKPARMAESAVLVDAQGLGVAIAYQSGALVTGALVGPLQAHWQVNDPEIAAMQIRGWVAARTGSVVADDERHLRVRFARVHLPAFLARFSVEPTRQEANEDVSLLQKLALPTAGPMIDDEPASKPTWVTIFLELVPQE